MMVKRLSIVVEGTVQGVGFRYFTQAIAAKLNISGWVRNRYDGAVEIEAQGETSQVDKFVNNVKEGPPASNVEAFSISEIAVVDNEIVFEIKH